MGRTHSEVFADLFDRFRELASGPMLTNLGARPVVGRPSGDLYVNAADNLETARSGRSEVGGSDPNLNRSPTTGGASQTGPPRASASRRESPAESRDA